MRTLGVDLAAAAKKTAAAVIEWADGGARLAHLSLDVGDDEIVRLFAGCDMTGIDCPARLARRLPSLPRRAPDV